MKYRLEKLVDGEWWEEGTYNEGYFIKHLATAAFCLGRFASKIDNIRVVIEEDEK